MDKTKLGAGSYLLPMPVVLVGTNVDNRPNFLTIAYVGMVGHAPAMIEIALRKNRFSSAGIKENQTFSVNAASASMVDATDYCGIYSGKKVDKSKVFEVFYGELKTAPMIAESPLNLECQLAKVLDLGGDCTGLQLRGIPKQRTAGLAENPAYRVRREQHELLDVGEQAGPRLSSG